ncbi:MAG: anion permease [Gemmatimonadales bacterium]|nr:anion permease [Gemmatimonadales bacterium]
MLQRNHIGVAAGIVLCGAMLVVPTPDGLTHPAWRTAAVGVLMATWWVTEAIPIAATSLVPLVLFPLLGISSIGATAAPYANPVIFLFMGGFLIAAAWQRTGLHLRMALSIVRVGGMRPRRLVGSVMIATTFISMWVSSTATTAMLLPVALSIVALVRVAPHRRLRLANSLGESSPFVDHPRLQLVGALVDPFEEKGREVALAGVGQHCEQH